jgi:DNA polymerase (family 10)
MKDYNKELSQMFSELADLLAILAENPFEIRAYRQVSRRLAQSLKPITKKEASEEEFKKIPGVGEAIAKKMLQYIQEGKIDLLEKLRKQVPKPVREMLDIPHLGPNRVKELYLNLGITNKKLLLKAAQDGSIEALPGFGEKLVKSIVDAIKSGQQKKKRHERQTVRPYATKLLKALQRLDGVKAAEIAGSYRRKKSMVGDLDILVTGHPAKMDTEMAIRKSFDRVTLLGSGETKSSFVIFPENLQVDIRFVPEESYGAALLYFTGSKEFNVMMRKKAIEQGYLLNEYGLFKRGEMVAGKTEEEVFEKLGMEYVPPKKRK